MYASTILLSWKHNDYTGHLTRHIWHHRTVSVSSHRWHTPQYRRSALLMTSQQVCKSSHLAHVSHHTQYKSHHIHSLWHQWSCFMTPQTLYSWHQTPYIWDHTHGNTNIISAILHLCHQNRVSIIAQLLSVWYHIDNMCDFLLSMHAITTTLYDIIPLCV